MKVTEKIGRTRKRIDSLLAKTQRLCSAAGVCATWIVARLHAIYHVALCRCRRKKRPRLIVEGQQRSSLASWHFILAGFCLSVSLQPVAADELVLRNPKPTNGQWTLELLIEEAVTHHPSVQASQDAMRGGQARVRSARWQYFPAPSVGFETQTLGGDPVVTAEVTQPIWTGGRLSADLKVAKAQRDATKWGVTEAQNAVALQIVAEYQRFASAMLTLNAYDRYIDDLSDFSAMMERRVAQGYSATIDSKLVLARLNEAQNVRTNLRLARNSSVASLGYLTGRDFTVVDVALPEIGAAQMAIGIGNDEFLQRSQAVNPTFNRLSHEIAVANAEVSQARSALSPVVSLKAQHRELSFSPVTENRVFLSLDFSLGGGLSSLEAIRAAKAKKSEAVHSREAFRVDLNNTVRNDIETLKATGRLINTLSENSVTQQQIYQSYLRMFLVGQRTWLDVLNVMREAVEAERSLGDARATYIATLFRLRINVGDITWQ